MAITGVSDETKKKQEEYRNPTASVLDAEKAAEDYTVNNDPRTNSKYGMVAEELLEQYLNREDFKYDVNGDALYAQYKDQYTKNANKAMKDTVAQSAAYSGGYSNSWGQTAGQQIYQDYMTELDNKIPELRQQAYNEYLAEGEMLLNKYGITQGHYQDLMNQFYTERDYLDDEADKEYNKWLTERDYWDGVAANESADYWNVQNYNNSSPASSGEGYYEENDFERMVQSGSYVNDKGKTIYTYYRDGEEYEFEEGKNPYTGTIHPDAKDKDGKYDSSKTFSNGYQPNNIEGKKLTKTGYEGTVNGVVQNVWTTGDGRYWMWDGSINDYFEVNDPATQR